ncbi:unannotated protein [freshwater metagenome]|uniref:Unannotated protein n=1 Tax=freshwater metagenome TaxID=449393 RepID=A0A6J7HCR5_9ZZZZ
MGVHRDQPVGVGPVVGQAGVGVGRPGDRGDLDAVAQHPVGGHVGLGVRRPAELDPAVAAHGGQPGGHGRGREVRRGGRHGRRGRRPVAVGVHGHQPVGVRGVVGQPGVGVGGAGDRGDLDAVAQHPVGGQVGLGVRRPGQVHPAVAAHRGQPGRGGGRGQVGGRGVHRRGGGRPVGVGVHGHQPVAVGAVVGQPGVGVRRPGDRGDLQPVPQHAVGGQVGLGVRRPGQRDALLAADRGQPGRHRRRGQVGGGGVDLGGRDRPVVVPVDRDERVAVGAVVDQARVGVAAGAGRDGGHLDPVAQQPVGGHVGLGVGRPRHGHLAVAALGEQHRRRAGRGQVGGRGHHRRRGGVGPLAGDVDRLHRVAVGGVVGQPRVDEAPPCQGAADRDVVAQHLVAGEVGLGVGCPGHGDPPVAPRRCDPGRRSRGDAVSGVAGRRRRDRAGARLQVQQVVAGPGEHLDRVVGAVGQTGDGRRRRGAGDRGLVGAHLDHVPAGVGLRRGSPTHRGEPAVAGGDHHVRRGQRVAVAGLDQRRAADRRRRDGEQHATQQGSTEHGPDEGPPQASTARSLIHVEHPLSAARTGAPPRVGRSAPRQQPMPFRITPSGVGADT